MRASIRPNGWIDRLAIIKARLLEPLWWFPYPFLLPFSLVTLLTTHILFATNPRMGNPADVITFPSKPQRDSAIWLSVTPIGDEIVVTTNDRRVFRWSQKIRSEQDVKALSAYLRERGAKEIQASALMKTAMVVQTNAVIAADQRLKFLHIRPLLYALAKAGITNYAFETHNPVAAAAPHHGGGDRRE